MIKFRQKDFSVISKTVRFVKELRTIDKLPISEDEYIDTLFAIQGKKLDIVYEKLQNFYGISEEAVGTLFRIGRAKTIGYYSSNFSDMKKANVKNPRQDKKLLDAINKSWLDLQKLPKRYLFSNIGAGSFGICFDYPGGKVEKISYAGFRPAEYKFYEALYKNSAKYNNVFPKIYTLEKDQVIMEKLLINTPKCKKYGEWIKKYTTEIHDPGGRSLKEVDWDKLKEELGIKHEFYIFLKQIESGLKDIFGIKTIGGDLRPSNIGERKGTGEIIFFDPANGLLME